MHGGYLIGSAVALVLGVLCFLAPNAITRLSQVTDRCVGVVSDAVLKHRLARYVFGLGLLLLSFALFRLSYLPLEWR